MSRIETLRTLIAESEIPLPCATGEDVGFPLLILDETGCEVATVFGPNSQSIPCLATATLIAESLNRIPTLLDAAESWEQFLSAQETIDNAGWHDNYTDAARAREAQARAIDRARRTLAALEES